MSGQLDNLTLREKLNEAERLVRELIHHLEHGFIPKAHVLRRTAQQGVQPEEQDQVSDMTMRSTVDDVTESDEFTRRVSHQIEQFLAAIDKDVQRILGGG